MAINLPTIPDAFAEHFDEFPSMYPDRDDDHFLVATGRLVRAVLVVGQLVADGSIVLFSVDIDPILTVFAGPRTRRL